MTTNANEQQDDMSAWLERAEAQRQRFIKECTQGGDVATVRWLERLRERTNARTHHRERGCATSS